MRRGCTVLLLALADLSHPALARTYLNCTTREVVIVNESGEELSSTKETNRSFWVDDVAKTVMFADGTALTVTQFDDNWLNASRDDSSYVFDRRNGTLSFDEWTRHNCDYRIRPV